MMRLIIYLVWFFSVLAMNAQTKGDLLGRFDSQRQGTHFVYQWNSGETTEAEIDEAAILAEDVYQKLTRVFGKQYMPSAKLIITFGGEGLNRKTGKKRTPNVDFQGRTHLYRFDMGGYLTPLPHELVHAVRVGRVNWQGFFEEGIASGIAYHLYPERKGFPRFGFSLDLIAGYWLNSGKAIPMRTMLNQHRRLNLKCQLQTYVLREDFFNYLINQHGLNNLVNLAYSELLGSDEGYTKHFGKSLETLAEKWEADLAKRFKKIDQADALVSDYFQNTSAKYIPVCEAGADY